VNPDPIPQPWVPTGGPHRAPRPERTLEENLELLARQVEDRAQLEGITVEEATTRYQTEMEAARMFDEVEF
jgi:FKBP-type peptidyl-prolyl cis-trans isomerase (trigger factor)